MIVAKTHRFRVHPKSGTHFFHKESKRHFFSKASDQPSFFSATEDNHSSSTPVVQTMCTECEDEEKKQI
jgi:hypothetical protein